MEIAKALEGRLLTVSLTGELNTTTAPDLEKAISDDIKAIDNVIFDMTDLTYITSSGLRILLASQQELEDRGTVTVRGANPVIREIIEVTGFDSILNIE